MKKVLLAFMLILLNLGNANAQKILANGTPMKSKPGWILYATSSVSFAYIKDENLGVRAKLLVSIQCEKNVKTNLKKYILVLTTLSETNIDIRKNSPLLLKLQDGSVVTLHNDTYYEPDYSASLGDYYNNSGYYLTDKILKQLRYKNTEKVRLFSLTQKLDYKLPAGNFRDAFNQCYDLIQTEIGKNETGIYDNF